MSGQSGFDSFGGLLLSRTGAERAALECVWAMSRRVYVGHAVNTTRSTSRSICLPQALTGLPCMAHTWRSTTSDYVLGCTTNLEPCARKPVCTGPFSESRSATRSVTLYAEPTHVCCPDIASVMTLVSGQDVATWIRGEVTYAAEEANSIASTPLRKMSNVTFSLK